MASSTCLTAAVLSVASCLPLPDCWGAAFLHALRAVKPALGQHISSLQELPVTEVCELLDGLWQAKAWTNSMHQGHTGQHRSDQGQKGYKLATYRRWFCKGKLSDGEPAHCSPFQRHGFMYHVYRPQQVHVLAAFRLSAHDLNIEKQRYNRTQRYMRVCKCCTANVVEDEMHVLECPAYQHIWQNFQDVVGNLQYPLTDHDMYTLMNPTEPSQWRRLATLLLKVMTERARIMGIG